MKPRKIYNHKLIYFLAVLCIILFATIEYYFITPINNYNENISLVKKEDLYNHYKRKIQTQPYYKYNIKTNSSRHDMFASANHYKNHLHMANLNFSSVANKGNVSLNNNVKQNRTKTNVLIGSSNNYNMRTGRSLVHDNYSKQTLIAKNNININNNVSRLSSNITRAFPDNKPGSPGLDAGNNNGSLGGGNKPGSPGLPLNESLTALMTFVIAYSIIKLINIR